MLNETILEESRRKTARRNEVLVAQASAFGVLSFVEVTKFKLHRLKPLPQVDYP